MGNESQPNPIQPPPLAEAANVREPEPPSISAIETLPEALGLIETPEVSDAKAQFIDALMANDPAAISQAAEAYHSQAAQLIDRYRDPEENEAYKKAQIGRMVAVGLCCRQAGRADDYLDELYDALNYAENAGFADIAVALQAAISEAQ